MSSTVIATSNGINDEYNYLFLDTERFVDSACAYGLCGCVKECSRAVVRCKSLERGRGRYI